jgi:chemotaxis family two-component system response regulator Rcp1
MNQTQSDFHILLIEDSRADAKIIERALREASVDHRLTVIPDGRQALDFLMGLPDEADEADQSPDLILLDLNLPGLNGCQVLRRIKDDPQLRWIPVVVLTTSIRDEDVAQTYHAGANTYIPKPAEYPDYCSLVETLSGYWIKTALRMPKMSRRQRPGPIPGGSAEDVPAVSLDGNSDGGPGLSLPI